MNYLRSLNLNREPFSNTPDPDFFFHSKQHLSCLQKVEVSIRLRRGLNVVIGDVGMGKTTLCRQLLRLLANDEKLETYLIMDPSFENPNDFLSKVYELFTNTRPEPDWDIWDVKEGIKKFLFSKGVDENKTVALIIDEGQKTPEYGLEILREFLNYETNEFKLLQIVIFAQNEFKDKIKDLKNFTDRINFYRVLEPFNFRDTREMIKYRLTQASDIHEYPSIFTFPALWAIYRATGGYPRKIIHLCHQCLLAMIVDGRKKVDSLAVRTCLKGMTFIRKRRIKRSIAMTAAAVFAALAAALILEPDILMAIRTELTGAALQADQSEPVKNFHKEKIDVDLNKTIENLPAPKDTPKVVEPVVQTAAINREQASGAPANAASGAKPGEPAAVSDETPASADSEEERPSRLEKGTHGVTSVISHAVVEDMIKPAPPQFLGEVKIKVGESASVLIRDIYGKYTDRLLNSVARENPVLGNMEKIPIDFSIKFPAVKEDVKPKDGEHWWLQYEKTASLEEAYHILRSVPELRGSIRIVPYWNEFEGLRFIVMLRGIWSDRESAKKHINKLPKPAAEKFQAMNVWDDETIFYADPFQDANLDAGELRVEN